MTELERILEANRAFAEGFDGSALGAKPGRPVLVLTCIDARMDPAAMLGFELGDANVIRNAGGRITQDAIRSALVSSWLLGTREFLVIHHTECGMTRFTDDVLHGLIRDATGIDVSGEEYLTFSDVERTAREDVAKLRAVETFPEGVNVTGFVYDVRTGALTELGG